MATDGKDAPIVIAGGSGFMGRSLTGHLLASGRRVIVLSRGAPTGLSNVTHVSWDARTQGDWRSALEGSAGLVNLVGRSVDCIKTPDHQDEILRSRMEATQVLGQAMRTLDRPPPVWVQMSTAHIYGDPPETVCNEDSAFGIGFAPTVGRAWESAFQAAVLSQQRQVILRTSFVIGRDRGSGGGALARLRTLVRLGLGGVVGTGKQGMSWIHETDMNHLIETALFDPQMSGPYIATAPHPLSQREFIAGLRKAMRLEIGLPAFAWMVRLGAPLLLRTDPELDLYGRYLVSKRLKEAGFAFQFGNLSQALNDLLKPFSQE